MIGENAQKPTTIQLRERGYYGVTEWNEWFSAWDNCLAKQLFGVPWSILRQGLMWWRRSETCEVGIRKIFWNDEVVHLWIKINPPVFGVIFFFPKSIIFRCNIVQHDLLNIVCKDTTVLMALGKAVQPKIAYM